MGPKLNSPQISMAGRCYILRSCRKLCETGWIFFVVIYFRFLKFYFCSLTSLSRQTN